MRAKNNRRFLSQDYEDAKEFKHSNSQTKAPVSSSGANLTGSLLGSRAAVRLMRTQPLASHPTYHIFNLGFSGWGARFSRTAVTHKSSKTGLTALIAALREELNAAGALASIHRVYQLMKPFLRSCPLQGRVWHGRPSCNLRALMPFSG